VTTCARLKARDCGAIGLQVTNSCINSTFTDIDIDGCWGHDGAGPSTNLASTGIYLEHFVRNCVFQRFLLGGDSGDLEVGITSEWSYGQNAALNGSITLPQATIPTKADVYNLTQWDQAPAPGTLYLGETGQQTITYTGI